ncbi:histone-lysine N-methyltransferase SETMAR [Trichonephila clavipes]|nr:histone-lysine N-methyltransferase SETMAR [Trichonephila clavipes]
MIFENESLGPQKEGGELLSLVGGVEGHLSVIREIIDERPFQSSIDPSTMAELQSPSGQVIGSSQAWHEFEPLKAHRVGWRGKLNLSRAETSSRWCGVVVRRGDCRLRCHPRHLAMVQKLTMHDCSWTELNAPNLSRQHLGTDILFSAMNHLRQRQCLGLLSPQQNFSQFFSDDDPSIQDEVRCFSFRDGHPFQAKDRLLSRRYNQVLLGIRTHSVKSRSCQVIYSQFGLAIHQNDHQARRRFVEWAQNEIAVVPDFHKRILFSDEAHFWLNGHVNKQNCRIWSEANPQVYVETPLHPEKLTVWCALWAGGILFQKR